MDSTPAGRGRQIYITLPGAPKLPWPLQPITSHHATDTNTHLHTHRHPHTHTHTHTHNATVTPAQRHSQIKKLTHTHTHTNSNTNRKPYTQTHAQSRRVKMENVAHCPTVIEEKENHSTRLF